ncbi:hypothetical protein [Clostridium uliginosum]|uniref:Uncharacterized protein n=1 Tax=Clostridium uliginosum TaxID=119641 RepID=A0A1I1GSG4_9CLOT|nr:hypothetical protein [Clostridium uliginosum]SFC14727.1 hypothetical protein SAMN05421842_10152 [Clostridium uliginosum]
MFVIYCIFVVLAICIFCGVCIGIYNVRVSNAQIETRDLLKKQVKLQEEQIKDVKR